MQPLEAVHTIKGIVMPGLYQALSMLQCHWGLMYEGLWGLPSATLQLSGISLTSKAMTTDHTKMVTGQKWALLCQGAQCWHDCKIMVVYDPGAAALSQGCTRL